MVLKFLFIYSHKIFYPQSKIFHKWFTKKLYPLLINKYFVFLTIYQNHKLFIYKSINGDQNNIIKNYSNDAFFENRQIIKNVEKMEVFIDK